MTILQNSRGLPPALKYFIALSFLILFIFFGYYFLIPNNLNFLFDNIISDSIKEKIFNKLDLNIVKKNNACQLLEKIKEFCPAAKKITIDYKIPLNTNIKIDIDKPILILKYKDLTNEILTQHGLIDTVNSFRPETLENLNIINVDTKINNTDLKRFKEFALSLSSEIFEKYNVAWCSNLKILLRSLIFKDFLVITDVASIKDKNKLTNAELIYKQKSKEKKSGIKIDIRLKDSIICAPFVGGIAPEGNK